MSAFFDAIISGLIAAIGGGAIVAIAQQVYVNRRDKRKEEQLRQERLREAVEAKKIIPQNTRLITSEAIWRLKPGTNIEVMRQLLGIPLSVGTVESDIDLFNAEKHSEPLTKYYYYLYIFENANLKICTRDNISIDAITVTTADKGITIPALNYPSEEGSDALGEAKITKELIERCNKHTYIATRIDSSFAIQVWLPNPFYLNYTLFGFAPDHYSEYMDTKNPSIFIGREIWGICISNTENAFYIFDIETR